MQDKKMVVGTKMEVENVSEEVVDLLKAQATVCNHLFAYAETLALRCAVELRIADIIHSYGHPISISQIASKLESPSPNVTCLARVMQILVRKKIFTIENKWSSSLGDDEFIYGPTNVSKCLLHDHEESLAPAFLMLSHHTLMKPWFEISSLINKGENPFVKAHGETFGERASKDPEFNSVFNSGMAACTKPALDAFIKGYKEGLSKLEGTLIDVGGGIGALVTKIVKAYPHIKGVNFDLPRVLANAPQYPGVTHVCGDIFKEIPSADNVIIKCVLHDWSDADCLKILKNCKQAISQNKKGKVIIVEIVLQPEGHSMFDDASIGLDLLMMTTSFGGRERTEGEWKKLLKEAGYPKINIIPLQTLFSYSIIEAFPY